MAAISRLADGDPLAADAVILRGGESTPETMMKSALDHYDACLDDGIPAEYALSVEYRLGCSAEEIAHRGSPFMARYQKMRRSTAGAVAATGFPVVRAGRDGHALIKLGDELADDAIERVDSAFAAPEPNPGWRRSNG